MYKSFSYSSCIYGMMAIVYVLFMGTSPICSGEEVLINGNFETGTTGWISIGPPILSTEINEPFEGWYFPAGHETHAPLPALA